MGTRAEPTKPWLQRAAGFVMAGIHLRDYACGAMMRWLPYGSLALSFALFITLVASTSPLLPEKVASHFNFYGEADGWMNKGGYLVMTHLFGLGLPSVMMLMFQLTRYLPGWMVNMPNKEYWLSPARRSFTANLLTRHGAWLGCATLFLLAGLHALAVQANRMSPPRMASAWLATLMVLYFVGLGWWTFSFSRLFRLGR